MNIYIESIIINFFVFFKNYAEFRNKSSEQLDY